MDETGSNEVYEYIYVNPSLKPTIENVDLFEFFFKAYSHRLDFIKAGSEFSGGKLLKFAMNNNNSFLLTLLENFPRPGTELSDEPAI